MNVSEEQQKINEIGIKNLFTWFNTVCVEEQKVFIILESTDSCFPVEVNNYEPKLGMQLHEIGEFSFKSSKLYFKKLCKTFNVTDLDFQTVYNIIGGNIVHMQLLLVEYVKLRQDSHKDMDEILHDCCLSFGSKHKQNLIKFLVPGVELQNWARTLPMTPSDKQILGVQERILMALLEKGFIHENLIVLDHLSEQVVKFLVENEILHFRQQPCMVLDPDNEMTTKNSVLIPRTPLDLYFLKRIDTELKQFMHK